MDIILDCVGAPYLERNMTCLATDGCVVYIGWMGGETQLCLYCSYTRTYTLRPPPLQYSDQGHVNAVCSGGGTMLSDVRSAFQLSLLASQHALCYKYGS